MSEKDDLRICVLMDIVYDNEQQDDVLPHLKS
jgi:hypothetical protein